MKSLSALHVILASGILLQTSFAVAQTTEEEELALVYGDKSTISIATGSKQQLRRAPAVATVITAEDITVMGAADLDEVLETVPGIHVRSVFRYDMEDIIRAVPNVAPVLGATFNNTGGQHGSRMELEAMWDINRSLRLSGNYAYQRSIDESTNKDAGHAPHHQLYARADWRFAGTWLLSSQVNWIADRKRAVGDNRPPVPDYKTVDLALRTSRGKG